MTHLEKVRKYYEGKERLIKGCIKAMEELLVIYKDDAWARPCPLCAVESLDGCSACPWFVLGGGECHSVRWFIKAGKKKARMQQIRRWIAVYKRALEPRRV